MRNREISPAFRRQLSRQGGERCCVSIRKLVFWTACRWRHEAAAARHERVNWSFESAPLEATGDVSLKGGRLEAQHPARRGYLALRYPLARESIPPLD